MFKVLKYSESLSFSCLSDSKETLNVKSLVRQVEPMRMKEGFVCHEVVEPSRFSDTLICFQEPKRKKRYKSVTKFQTKQKPTTYFETCYLFPKEKELLFEVEAFRMVNTLCPKTTNKWFINGINLEINNKIAKFELDNNLNNHFLISKTKSFNKLDENNNSLI